MKTEICDLCGSRVAAVSASTEILVDCRIRRKSLACYLCSNLHDLEKEIRETKIRLEHLLHRRRELKVKANHVHDPIIHRLPVEIASAIFTLCTPLDINDLFGTRRAGWKVPTPITIGAVCQTWRYIAWSTPQIWTSVLLRPDQPDISTHADLVSEWLSRSSALPLTVKIESIYSVTGMTLNLNTRPSVDRLFDIINDVSSRWMTLDLNLPQHLLRAVCGNFGPSNTCILSHIFLNRIGTRHRTPFSLKDISPQPTVLHASGFFFTQIYIDWSNLREVSFEDIGFDDCLAILDHTPRLISFAAVRAASVRDRTLLPPPQHILHQSLEYYYEKGVGLSQVYERLTLPSLRTLRCDASHIISCESLHALIDRSSCPLETLSISGTSGMMSTDSLMRLLYILPSLNDLELIDFSSSDLLDKLSQTSQHSAEIFIPNLRALRVQGRQQIHWSLLPDILATTRDGGGGLQRPLTTLKISITYTQSERHEWIQMDSATLQRLRELQSGGFHIEVMDGDGRDLLNIGNYDEEMKERLVYF